MNLLSESATPRNAIKEIVCNSKTVIQFCRTFNANVLSIYVADNIRKIPLIWKLNSYVYKPVMFWIC
jgi:hypothetical protein